ncbi:MerR family transcriptional regulator [Patescibacteria group bacterium]|nr:MerR family transcriptional regulator [Patescibacteria group bacterium]MBU2579878.1 MerR family transcriptional regulator [Patescibacteria group bacterium]
MNKKLIKIGQLAKEVGSTVSEIKFYTQKGLLKPSGHTPGKHRLYDHEKSLKVIEKIKELQKEAQKFQLKNIKKLLK